MAIKNILLHLYDSARNKANLQVALALASEHNAQITALYTITPWTIPTYVAAYIPQEVIDRQRRESEAIAAREKVAVLEICRKQGVKVEWRMADGDAAELMAVHAHYADLAVVGQPDPDQDLPMDIENLPHELVMTAGRPVLVVPYAGKFTKIGGRVLIAWNASREAVRAVNDAMHILVNAKKVIVLSVNPTRKDHIPGADIAAHLARHGCKVEATHTVAKDIDVGDTLLGAVSDYGADLLVMGAWGHSRTRELVLGGATRELLRQMTVPVMMSH